MKVEIKGKDLVITVPIVAAYDSNSGRTKHVLPKSPAVETEVKVDGKPLFVQAMAYYKKG